MLKFTTFSKLSWSDRKSGKQTVIEGFGEGGDEPIGALSPPARKSTKIGESGASFSRSDFVNLHAENGGGPKFNKRSEHGGYSFYNPYEKK